METNVENKQSSRNDGNTVLVAGLSECKNDKHKPRDNKFGITWCVRCGRLFNKPCGKDLQDIDRVFVNACH